MIKKTIVENKPVFITLFIYAFLLLFFCSKMSPLYPFNEWSDINLYFNIGKGIFNGQVPYNDTFDHKGPLIFFIYGIGYLISNTSFLGMYIIESLLWAVMIFAVYFTARLYLDKVYSFIVAIIFPLFVLSHSSEGGSAEEFILIFEVISIYFFILYFKEKDTRRHRPLYMLIHGLMCGMVMLIKINLVVFWVFPLLAILVNLILKKEYQNLFKNIIYYLIGLAIIILPVCIYFIANNALGNAWDTYIVLNKNYARLGDAGEILENLVVRFYQRLRFETFEYLVILLGVFYFPIRNVGNILGKIALILSFVTLHVVIFMSPNYVFYYSVPYYIFSALGCIVIADILSKYLKLANRWYSYLVIYVIVLMIGIYNTNFFGVDKDILLRKKEPEGLVFQFSKIVEKEKKPTLLNLGLDLGNGVFTKANILSNVKYFISPNLPYDTYPEMRDEQTEYIEDRKVQFIILAEFSFNFEYFHNLPSLTDNYEVVDTYVEHGTKTYYLYKRKD